VQKKVIKKQEINKKKVINLQNLNDSINRIIDLYPLVVKGNSTFSPKIDNSTICWKSKRFNERAINVKRWKKPFYTVPTGIYSNQTLPLFDSVPNVVFEFKIYV